MGETLYKVKIKATFKINLNVAFNMSECDKKDTLQCICFFTENHCAYFLIIVAALVPLL